MIISFKRLLALQTVPVAAFGQELNPCPAEPGYILPLQTV